MIKLSLRIVILCLIVGLGAGMGIGHAIEARQVRALSSQIAQQGGLIAVLSSEAEQREEHVSTLNSEIKRLTAEIARLPLDIAKKQASYDLLLEKHDSTLGKLETLQASFASLSQEYQTLLDKHEALKEAGNGELAQELNRLREQVSFLGREIGLRDIQIAQLTDQLTPAPNHAVAGRDIWGRPEFRSTAWAGRDHELQRKIEEIARTFHLTHTFIEGEMDCNDIAVSLWNMLLTAGIKSVIVVGNLDMVGETFAESNHAWLYVFNARGEVIYLEPTTGEVFFGRLVDGSTNPQAIPYREGFIYVRPSDLRRDLKGQW
jgi:cell division protein FtsB